LPRRKQYKKTILKGVSFVEIANILTATLGYTYIPQGAVLEAEEADGVFMPSLGLDYFRRIHPRWEVGIMTDLDFGEYVIFEKELSRKNVLVATAIVAFNLTGQINIFAGGEWNLSSIIILGSCG
jgi:hypothetical protein